MAKKIVLVDEFNQDVHPETTWSQVLDKPAIQSPLSSANAGNNITITIVNDVPVINAADSTTDYEDLINRPIINGAVLEGIHQYVEVINDLIEVKDSGGQTLFKVDALGNLITKSFTTANLKALAFKDSIASTELTDSADLARQDNLPTTLAELAGDSTHRIVTDAQIASWNSKSEFSGSYNDLLNKPALFSGNYNDLSNKPTLFSGSYDDLTNKPTLFSGNYNDLTNKPTIPATNVIPGTATANKVLVSTTTSGTAKWSDWTSAGVLKTNASGVISIDTNTYLTSASTLDASKLSGAIPTTVTQTNWDSAYSHISLTNNPHSVTASQVGLGTTSTPTFAGISIGAGSATWTIDDSTANVLTFKDGANTRLEIKSGGLYVNGSSTPLGEGSVTSVLLASGTNNGTLKLTINGTATDNIAVKGLGSAAYTASTDYVAKNTSITGATKPKITYDAKGLVTGGSDLVESDIPELPQSKISNLETDLANKVTKNAIITAGTKTKITYDSKGLVTAGEDLVPSDIGAVEEALNDGKTYARKNKGWVEFQRGFLPDEETITLNGNDELEATNVAIWRYE